MEDLKQKSIKKLWDTKEDIFNYLGKYAYAILSHIYSS
jgi:hypothetical protein